MKFRKKTQELLKFINNSPCSYYTCKNCSNILLKNGYKELYLNELWYLEKGGKYFITHNNSSLIAFNLGQGDIKKYGFKLISSHTDSPCFKIKPNPEITNNSYLQINTETYGGMILNSWFDRPLSIAGRVTIKSKNILHPDNVFININKPILNIPNLAIHMNREVNNGIKINPQKDTIPILSTINKDFEKDNYLLSILSKELSIPVDNILDFDLYLYEYENGNIFGINDEFISSSRLDDLSMVYASLNSLISSKESQYTNVLVCFDNEEVGSKTNQGADSRLLSNILERICISTGKNREEYIMSLYNSFMISADMTHALHPNYVDTNDITNKVIINKGPVIKYNSNYNYTTDSFSASVYKQICKNESIPYQEYVNKSGIRGGSTLGPISTSQVNIKTIDIGNPLLSMHSIREMAGVYDQYYVEKSFNAYYNI